MEKLQKALISARQKRTDGSSANTQPATPAREQSMEYSGKPNFPLIWNKLKSYDPDPAALQANRIITLNAQPTANPFDILRTKIFLMMQQNGWTRLAITSPDKGCGKTTTACNLTASFSRQSEVKSLLLDLDMRRPQISSLLNYTPEHDIKDLLTEAVSAEEQLVRLRSNVAISMAKRPVNDPIQILMSQQTSGIFDKLQRDFEPEIIIFDLPPMLVTDDARAVLPKVDCALIVAKAEQTKMSQLDVCEREVAGLTNVLGVVLNNCRHHSLEDEYDDYY